ncbi:hypothetical protein DUNSADRAFT_14439 [Dunaliella salina]|uniref:Uncharacterized protein n=1 Tax=Dunaliella salina TaxID=3046 RepID=A0ABQ7H9J7_DUNSA|nr:hypothetical protein DUNSADRAFT_14439 [Dunaliella salina]|eukprot:KAF5843523.1 hypothetical protein DUNSADRAFT_14439 [Dunaliella salina]
MQAASLCTTCTCMSWVAASSPGLLDKSYFYLIFALMGLIILLLVKCTETCSFES